MFGNMVAMDIQTVNLDDKTRTIIEAKALEMAQESGGNAGRLTSAAIRAIILEWAWIKSMGQSKDKQAAK